MSDFTITLGGSADINVTVGGAVELVLTPPKPPGPTPSTIETLVTARYERFTVTSKGDTVAYNLADDHQVTVEVAYVDARGHPATVQSTAWSSSDETIVTVTQDATNPQQCLIVPAANLGNAQVTATSDADLGEGVTNLLTTMDITVVGGAAVTGTITPTAEAVPIPPEAAQLPTDPAAPAPTDPAPAPTA